MASSDYATPENEQELRARILARSQRPEDYTALAHLLLESPGREDEGFAVLEQALELPLPDIQKARISAEVAWFLYELNQRGRAMTMAKRALSDIAGQPEAPDLLMTRGISHATLAMYEYSMDRVSSDRHSTLAVESFELLLGQYPDWGDLPDACHYAAGVYVLREEYAKAAALYGEAMRRDPSERNRLESLVYLGNALRCQGHYAEAEARLREALGMVEVDRRILPRIYFELGKLLRVTNRPGEAVIAFEQALSALDFNLALRRNQDFVGEIRWELGYLYCEAKRYEEAISAFREALSNLVRTHAYPYCNALVSLGYCYLMAGQYAKARDCYEEVLASEEASDEERMAAQEGLSRLPPTPPPTIH